MGAKLVSRPEKMNGEHPSRSAGRLPVLSFAGCLAAAVALSALFYPPLRVTLFSMEHQSSDWQVSKLINRDVCDSCSECYHEFISLVCWIEGEAWEIS